MKNRNKLVLVLIITLNLIYCGKKEENKPQEDTITNIESNASDIESTPMAPETENPILALTWLLSNCALGVVLMGSMVMG